jgi:hypothetical protein
VVEELVRECLGENGHKLFMESEDDEERGQEGHTIEESVDNGIQRDTEDEIPLEEDDYTSTNMDSEEDVEEDFDDSSDWP